MLFTRLALILLVPAGPVLAEVVSYEGDSFPESQGWERVTNCLPERSVQSGMLLQTVEVGECGPPPGGDMDAYTRTLDVFDGAETFFVEFRMLTDADRSEMTSGGRPTFVDPASYGPVQYHFTMVRDQVKFIRDVHLPIPIIDIEPDVFHTSRLELYGETSYIWYLDNIVVDEGIPEGAYPSYSPFINFGAHAYLLDSNATWDYARYGHIPADGSGDFDSDGEVDFDDYYYFQECFSGPEVDAGPGCRWADFDADTDVDCADWAAFLSAWTDPGDPPVFTPCANGIPTVSGWGVVVMTLLLLAAGTLAFRSHRPKPTA